MLRRHNQFSFLITVLLDIFFSGLGWVLTYAIRFHWGPALVTEPRWLFSMSETSPPPFAEFGTLIPVVIVCNLLALGGMGLYRPARTRSLLREQLRVSKAALLGWIIILAVFYFLRQYRYSARMVIIFLGFNAFALMSSRFVLLKVLLRLRAHGKWLLSVAIIGIGQPGREVLLKLRDNPWAGIEATYFLDTSRSGGRARIHGVPVLYCNGDLVSVLRDNPVDMVVVALSRKGEENVNRILRDLAQLPVTVTLIPDLGDVMRVSANVGEFDSMPVIQLRDSPVYGWRAVAKRFVDIAGSLLIIVLLWWLMLILAVLVKLMSRGPVLYKQERMGLGGHPFTMLKFRSMRPDAEAATGAVWAVENDPRRTLVGAFMRATSMDELPQLFNVLRGEMSLVGPRPERLVFVREFSNELPAYMLRHNVKAGITGWAQIKGLRGNTSLKRRLQCDLYYINNWSLALDLFILMLTPFAVLVNRNAY